MTLQVVDTSRVVDQDGQRGTGNGKQKEAEEQVGALDKRVIGCTKEMSSKSKFRN